ncbi:aminodeoxychorismate lyase [Morganella morganii]|uniref:Aminodeoxychorismate lyase n=1 Tax=Morganella morganii TaxID=582 RepID=A0A433ZT30_MORMO|nr:aminodeoxychorismate lyase [Morganella morganii]RUT65288.1 aminodeoxychorismate lyase [Morganella morganii]
MTHQAQYWVNGVPQHTIAISDRSVQFGDGCFTTMRIVNSKPSLLTRHLRRLHGGCEGLRLTPPDESLLTQWIMQAAEGATNAVLKVIISAGEQGRGYLRDDVPPVVILIRSAYPESYPALQERGLSLVKSPVPLSVNPYLAGIKHLNRLEQVLIRRYVAEQQADEAIVCDTDGLLTEGCSANLFWRCGDDVFTPSLTKCGVAGVMRAHILDVLKNSRYRCYETERFPQVLANADEVIMCNALMPVMPVNEIRADGRHHWRYTSRSLFTLLLPYCPAAIP